ncbi:DUF4372 domain-containing protein [Desulfoferrobacter suflitae]|uniref:DUF4372 domain-containing protein n=1 Tax=Desulfoferrobacter suflitae TaxID=2865782 RepID=UPI00338E541E
MPRHPYVLGQFLRLLPRYEFQRIVNKFNGDYRSRHFKCWNQLACMIFAHIRQESSLRDIDVALNAHSSKLYHIGLQQCPKSTLADANERRDYRIYEEFAKSMMQRARREYANTSGADLLKRNRKGVVAHYFSQQCQSTGHLLCLRAL